MNLFQLLKKNFFSSQEEIFYLLVTPVLKCKLFTIENSEYIYKDSDIENFKLKKMFHHELFKKYILLHNLVLFVANFN